MPTREQDDFLLLLGVDPATLAASVAGEPVAAAPPAEVDFHKLAALWAATEKKVQQDVHAVRDGLMQVYEGDSAAADAATEFQVHVDALFATFDGQLAQGMAKLVTAKSDAELAAVKSELKAEIDGLIRFVATDQVVHIMDTNPFVAVDISTACTAVLTQLEQALA